MQEQEYDILEQEEPKPKPKLPGMDKAKPPLPGIGGEKKNLGMNVGEVGGTVGSSKAPLNATTYTPNTDQSNPFSIGGQYNQPKKLDADNLDLLNTKHDAAIAEQIKKYPLRKIPLTPILDNTALPKPITEIDINEALARNEQHKIDMQTAIDNTTLKVLKQKGIVAGKGSPYYEAERKKIEEKTKPTMIGGIVINGPEATFHKDKNGNIGLDRNLGFLEGIRKGFNAAVDGEDEANAFAEMNTQQKVEYANRQMEGKPTEYMEERGGVGELLGGAAPYLIKAAAAGTLATAAAISAPETGGASLVGLAPTLTVLLTAPDMIKQGAKDEIMTRYMQLKQERPNIPDEELMNIAQQGEISGGIVGAAQALAFTTTLKLPILNDSKSVLKTYLKGVASSAVHLGGIMAGTKAAQLAERKLEGYNVDTDKAVDEIATTFTENATAGAILNGLISGAHTLPKVVKSAFKYSLKDTPTSEIKTALDANVEAGRIPPEVAEQTISDIEGYKTALAKTSDGLTPETQASVAGLIQARDNVAAEMATKDPTQRAVYEQKIEAYNKQIEKITKTNDPLKYEIDEVTGNPIDKVAPELPDLTVPIEGTDKKGVPVGEDVPAETKPSTPTVQEGSVGVGGDVGVLKDGNGNVMGKGESKIIEVSPDGKQVKVDNVNGWHPIELFEVDRVKSTSNKLENLSEKDFDKLTPSQKVALYKEHGITKEDGSPITEKDIENSPLQYSYDFMASSDSGKWNSANSELESAVQGNRKQFSVYKLMNGEFDTFKEFVDFINSKNYGDKIEYTERMKRADDMSPAERKAAVDSYNKSVEDKVGDKSQKEKDILDEHGLKDETEYSPHELVEKFPLKGVQKVIWDIISPIVKKLDIKVKFSSSRITEGFDGSNNPMNGEILLRPSTLKNGRLGEVLVHEVVHSLTTKIISRVNSGVETGLTGKQVAAVKGLNKLYKSIKADNNLQNKYPVKDIFEFIAHLTNDSFVKELESKDRNFIQKVVDFISDILGLNNANELAKKYLKDIIHDGTFLEKEGVTVVSSDYAANVKGAEGLTPKQRLLEAIKNNSKTTAEKYHDLKSKGIKNDFTKAVEQSLPTQEVKAENKPIQKETASSTAVSSGVEGSGGVGGENKFKGWYDRLNEIRNGSRDEKAAIAAKKLATEIFEDKQFLLSLPSDKRTVDGIYSLMSGRGELIDALNSEAKAVEQSLKEQPKAGSVGVGGDVETKINKVADEYLYHGTGEGAFRRIREEGLTPQGEKYLYFADIEQYAKTYAQRKGNSFGDRVLRVKKSDAYLPDENTTGGDFKIKNKINPNDIEIKHNGKWIPIQEFADENIGIMPISKAVEQSLKETTKAETPTPKGNTSNVGGEKAETKTEPIKNEEAQVTQDTKSTEKTGIAEPVVSEASPETKAGEKEPPKEPAEPVGEEGGKKEGITHAAVEELRKIIGESEYEGKPVENHETLIEEAQRKIKENSNAANEVLDKMENGGKITNKDNAVIAIYKATIDAEMAKNPTPELLKRATRLAKALDVSGTELGKALESRKLVGQEDNLTNFLLDKQSAQGTALTETQIKSESAKYEELKTAKEALEKQLVQEREQHAKDIAEMGVNKAKAKAKRESKKSSEDYKKERKDTVEAARKALKDIRDNPQASAAPVFRELVAIAPHVKEYVNSLVSEGVDKLDNIVNAVHAEFKDVLDGLTKRDVLNIMVGDYNSKPKDQTRNEKANTARLLEREAKLLKELERERKGEEKAKTESQKTQSNRRIDELKEKIKEVRRQNKNREVDTESPEDMTAGEIEYNAKLQKSLTEKAQKLTNDIRNKKYLEEDPVKPVFKKSRKTQLLEDKVIDLENKIRHERSKDEYNKRSTLRKGFDKVMEVLGVRRLVQSALDMSVPFRQGATMLSPRKIDVWAKGFKANLQSVFNPKKFERIMSAIRNDPMYHEMVKDNIVFNDLGSADPNLHNEDFRKSFVYKIPILSEPLKASNRSADAFLNVARIEMYKKLRNNLEKRGLTRESDPKAFKFIGNWTMAMTGRGTMHSALEKPAMNAVLGNTFYGARLMASRFNLLNPVTYFDPRIPKEAKREAMKDMAAFTLTMVSVATALSYTTGAKVSLNPDDGDFLQLRYGDKVYDISGGLANYVRTGLRILKAGYTKFTGTKYQGKEATKKAGESSLNFIRNKFSPNTAYAVDAFFGKNYGQEFDASEIAQIYPMYTEDFLQAIKEEGGLTATATVLLPNILGIGYGSYASKGQIDTNLEDLLQRNMRSDEMNSEKIHNYKDKGRAITFKEFNDFADKRDEKIKKDLETLFKKGINGKPYKDLTQEEVVDETNFIKANATRETKKELFGENKKSHKEKVEDKNLLKERKQNYKGD